MNEYYTINLEININTLQCRICMNIFKDPIIDSCGHLFCENCISKNWKKICPVNKKIIRFDSPNFVLKKILTTLDVYCDKCDTKLKIEDIIKHDIICKIKKNNEITKKEIISDILYFNLKKIKLENKLDEVKKKYIKNKYRADEIFNAKTNHYIWGNYRS